MDNVPFAPVYVRDPRLAPYVTSAQPVWLWSVRDPRVIWSNAAGAAVFGAATVSDLIGRVADLNPMATAEIVRLAGSLHQGGTPRLERLRGFGTGLVRLPVCACSRITFNDQTPAVLVIGTDMIGPELPLVERIRRLFDGTDQSIAVFSSDGTLVYATRGGHEQIGGMRTLADLGADALADEAVRTGWSTGTLACGRLIFDRIGTGAGAFVYVTFAVPAPVSDPTTATFSYDATSQDSEHSLRFGWHMDADSRFTLNSPELFELIGTATAQSRSWSDINADLALDPADAIARTIAARKTLSAIRISWPLENGSERLNIELSGLPIHDREGRFLGYRGFGVCRDLRQAAAQARQPAEKKVEPATKGRDAPLSRNEPAASGGPSRGPATPTQSVGDARPSPALVASGQNVVPFRAAAPATVGLSSTEHRAFSEIGRQLSARLDAAEPVQRPDLAYESAELQPEEPPPEQPEAAGAPAIEPQTPGNGGDLRALLDQLPYGILVYGADALYYANAAFLARVDYPDIAAFEDAGGYDRLLIEPGATDTMDVQSLRIETEAGEERRFDARLFTIPWANAIAHALVLIEPHPSPHGSSAAPDEARLQELERELREARQQVDDAQRQLERTAAQPNAVAKLSGEIRTALATIVGFSETMLQEGFGPIGNERYRGYLSDICAASRRATAALAGLPDPPDVGTGSADERTVALNDVVRSCVTQFQPEAGRTHVLIRTSLFPTPVFVSADAEGVRELIVDLLIHAIKATKAGGQVIVSTASAMDANGKPGATTLRVRDTGGELSDVELASALGPEIASQPGDTGSALASAKTRAETIGATFAIAGGANNSTLVTITFPNRRSARGQASAI
jgi:signal transduction histidine kinase